jgi:hypothetical protein
VETIWGEFKSLDLSNVLWGLAAIGRVPGQQAFSFIGL